MKYALERISGGPFFLSLRLLPSVTDGLIEQHFADKATILTQNEQIYREMREKLPLKPPFYDLTGRFSQEDLGENLKRLIFEKVYTTRRGFFGYQQHELINRRIMFHKKQAAYELLYDAEGEAARIAALLHENAHVVPGAVNKLLDQAPSGTNALSLFRTLQLVPVILDMLNGVEELSHRELDDFLMKAQAIVDTYGKEEIEIKLLEAGLDLPLLMASLHVDENGKVYCMLPGGLHYPRPKVLPQVQELFKDFLAAASDVGGSATFTAVQPGEFEISAVQSTEALALLIKTVVNNFYAQYMTSPEGMQRLQSTLMHPEDFQNKTAERIFMNPFWRVIMDTTGGALAGNVEESRWNQTVTDMKTIVTALEIYQIDFETFPKYDTIMPLQDIGLSQEYYSGAYTDAWGSPFLYISDPAGSQYLLMSYGKDQVSGSTNDDFDTDIVLINGQFVAPERLAPESDNRVWAIKTALGMAVELNATDFVKILLDLGADVNSTDDTTGEPLIIKAAQKGYPEMVKMLLEHGADIEVQDKDGLTALFSAAYEGHTSVVQLLLNNGADFTARNQYGMTALLWAAWNGYLDTLQVLLDHGEDVDVKDDDGETALMKAAFQGHGNIINVLLERGAAVDTQDSTGETALMNAANQGHTEIVKLLLEKNADVNITNDANVTALLSAAYQGHLEIVRNLVNKGAVVNVQNQYGMTPLLWPPGMDFLRLSAS